MLPRILRDMSERDLRIALHHGEFAAASALMEHHGVPIDMEVFTQLADADTWRAIRDAMVPMIDAQYGVYVRNAAGDWTFNMERFAAYLAREGIAWPLLETGNAQHAAQDLRGNEQGLAAARRSAPTTPRPRQDAQDQARCRRRRPQSHGSLALQVQDVAHPAEGGAVDLLARGMAALADQARAGDGGRLHRLQRHGVPDRGGRCPTGTAARTIPCSTPTIPATPI